jgi:beta-phosphoglucomutase-like phosphatase (HAD superfamily)
MRAVIFKLDGTLVDAVHGAELLSSIYQLGLRTGA